MKSNLPFFTSFAVFARCLTEWNFTSLKSWKTWLDRWLRPTLTLARPSKWPYTSKGNAYKMIGTSYRSVSKVKCTFASFKILISLDCTLFSCTISCSGGSWRLWSSLSTTGSTTTPRLPTTSRSTISVFGRATSPLWTSTKVESCSRYSVCFVYCSPQRHSWWFPWKNG